MSIRDSNAFNEAPASRGGNDRDRGRGARHDAGPSMRPPHHAGEMRAAGELGRGQHLPSMRPPHHAGEMPFEVPPPKPA